METDQIGCKSKAFLFFLYIYLHTYISIYIFSEHTLGPWGFVHESEHMAFEIHCMY